MHVQVKAKMGGLRGSGGSRFGDRIMMERLEARRLFAAWYWGPEIGPNDEDVGFYYTVDETGYHWEAEYGEMGAPKRYERGTLFRAGYDPNGTGADSPDVVIEQLLERVSNEYAHGWGFIRPVDFSIVDHGDNTFEIIGTPVGWDPANPPQFGEPFDFDPDAMDDWNLVEFEMDRNPYMPVLDRTAVNSAPQAPVVELSDTSQPPAPADEQAASPLEAMTDDLLFEPDEVTSLLG